MVFELVLQCRLGVSYHKMLTFYVYIYIYIYINWKVKNNSLQYYYNTTYVD
ncbi:MAG: hypothetical protein N7Q72_02765 [Spiroplasma sp. Tabriz.8]|nr:hypothetical protein [Spiroplasma sp. Tabriz.8]